MQHTPGPYAILEIITPRLSRTYPCRMAAGLLIILMGSSALAQQPQVRTAGDDQTNLSSLLSHTTSPTIWMGGSSGPDHGYPSLLTDYGAALVNSGTRVLKVYATDLAYGNPAEVRRILEFCRANGLKLAAEGYLVSAFSPSEVSEGEAPKGEIEQLIARLRSMNGSLDYFESDETLLRAHTIYKHNIRDVVANAARGAQILRNAFPGIQIADIEPFPMDLTELRTFLQDFAQEAHHPFEIYNPDIAWNSEYGSTMWLEKLKDLSKLIGSLQMRLAIIYNGNDKRSSTSLDWTNLAEQRIAEVEGDSSVTVNDGIIQTWVKIPSKVGPATEPGTMLNLTTVYRFPCASLQKRLPGEPCDCVSKD